MEKLGDLVIHNKILVSKILVNVVHHKCFVVEISRHYMSALNITIVHVMYMFMMEVSFMVIMITQKFGIIVK